MTRWRGIGAGGAAAALVAAVSSACGQGYTSSDAPASDAGPGDAADATPPPDATILDAPAEASAPRCIGTHGATMVDLGTVCIDRVEVTYEDYIQFANARGSDTTELPAACSYKTSLLPTLEWPPVAANLKRPVQYVDWCDAWAYCAWAGKRLCGKIGGGPAPVDQVTSTTVDEMAYACTSGGANLYPYGNVFDATMCDVSGYFDGSTAPIDVGSAPGCHGTTAPFDRVFDLGGNAAEWVDACSGDAGPDDGCVTKGGCWYSSNPGGACAETGTTKRSTTNSAIGFRCCQTVTK